MKSRPEKNEALVASTTKASMNQPSEYNRQENPVNNSTLIPVFAGVISNTTAQLCDARALHAFMQVKRDFTTWIKGRIRKFGFIAGDDYLTVENLSSPDLVSAKARAQKLADYHLTLDMAKELAMVENNEQGRAARRYFIECERWAMDVATQPQQMRLDYDRLTPAQAQDLKQIVQAIVDAGIQKYPETWSRLQRKFKVNSYLALLPDQYEAARAYLIAKLPNGYQGDLLEELHPLPINPFGQQAMKLAQINAINYARAWREQQAQGKDGIVSMEKIPADVLSGLVAESMMEQRWFVAYDYSHGGLVAQPLDKRDFASNWENLARDIASGERTPSNAQLIDVALACNRQLARRLGIQPPI